MAEKKKKEIREAIIVEGKDDTAAIQRAVEAKTIETHGFGMPERIWPVIDKAYRDCGIIIFTDPDYAGEKIRRTVAKRYPEAGHAFLARDKALKKGNIGVENATAEDILDALERAHCTVQDPERVFTMDDMLRFGLTGTKDAKRRRQVLGERLSIGYGNTKTFLQKLNRFGISREELTAEIKELK